MVPCFNLLVIPALQFPNIYLADLYMFVVENGFIFYLLGTTARGYRHSYSTTCCQSTGLWEGVSVVYYSVTTANYFSCISDVNNIDCVPHKMKITMQGSHNSGCSFAFYWDSSSIWDHKLKRNCSLFCSYLTFLCAINDSWMSSSNMQSVWVMDNRKVTEVWQTKLEIYWQSNVTKLVHEPPAFMLPFNLFPNSILIHKSTKIP